MLTEEQRRWVYTQQVLQSVRLLTRLKVPPAVAGFDLHPNNVRRFCFRLCVTRKVKLGLGLGLDLGIRLGLGLGLALTLTLTLRDAQGHAARRGPQDDGRGLLRRHLRRLHHDHHREQHPPNLP